MDRAGHRIIAIPPGRVIAGDLKTSDAYCHAFESYIWTLRYLRGLAREDPSLGAAFSRVADLEIAFFMRSRSGLVDLSARNPMAPQHLRKLVEHNEEDAFWTLGPGKKSKQFFAIVDASEVTVLTGEKHTALTLKAHDIETCLLHFGLDPFPLSNSKTAEERDPRGLGAYFPRNFGSPVYASHFAALWVHQGFLEATAENGAWYLRVARSGR